MNRRVGFLIGSVLTSAFLLLFLLVSVAFAAYMVVDEFNDGSWPEQASGDCSTRLPDGVAQMACAGPDCDVCYPSSNTYDGIGILGGERDITVTRVAGNGYATLSVDSNDDNDMSFACDSDTTARAAIIWDGNEGNNSTSERADIIDLDGRGGIDLTDGGTNDGFLLSVTDNDSMVGISIEVYSNTLVASNELILLGGLDNFSNREDLFFAFADFNGDLSVFASAGAIVLRIDGTIETAANLDVAYLKVSSVREYGDLPALFGEDTISANHIPLGLSLGNNVDAEGYGDNPVGGATRDDTLGQPDDEDGVRPTRIVNWSTVNGGSVDVTVERCGAGNTCYLNGWIDWNGDNDFDDLGDQIFPDDMPVDDSVVNTTFTFPIPAGTQVENNSFYARFRICHGIDECDNVTARNVSDGEIEDYLWSFGPTAITLSSFAVNPVGSNSTGVALAAAGVFGLGLLGSVLVSRRRKA